MFSDRGSMTWMRGMRDVRARGGVTRRRCVDHEWNSDLQRVFGKNAADTGVKMWRLHSRGIQQSDAVSVGQVSNRCP